MGKLKLTSPRNFRIVGGLLVIGVYVILFQNFSIPFVAVHNTAAAISSFEFNGGSPVAAGHLDVVKPVSAQAIQAITYDFTGGGSYVGAKMTLNSAASGKFVQFRVNAYIQNAVGLRITDQSGQTLQFLGNIDSSSVDDMGWATQQINVSSSTAHWGGANTGKLNGKIKSLTLMIPKPIVGGPTGTAFIKDIQVYDNAEGLSPDSPNFISDAKLEFINGSEFPGAKGNLQTIAASSSQSIQTLSYDFADGGAAAGARMKLNAPIDGIAPSFIHLKVNMPADASASLALQVVDKAGKSLQIPISLSGLVKDNLGWMNVTVPVSSEVSGSLQELSVLALKSGKNAVGKVYIKDVEMLDHAPSTFFPVLALAYSPVGNPSLDLNVASGAKGNLQTSPLTNGDVLQTLNYDFTSGGQTVSSRMNLPSAVHVNYVRFLAKAAPGAVLNVGLVDSSNQTCQVLLEKPLAVAKSDAWVLYSVDMDSTSCSPSKHPLAQLTIGIQHDSVAKQPAGALLIHGIQFDNDSTALDLNPSTQVLPGSVAVGANALDNLRDRFVSMKVNKNLMASAAKNRTFQGTVSGNPSSLQAMKLTGSGNTETVYVAWMNTAGSSAAVTLPNMCDHEIDLSGKLAKNPPCVTDMQGNALQCKPGANARMICQVSEEAGPIFIRMPAR